MLTTLSPRQPTVHFAEEPITCGGGEHDDDDDDEEEGGDEDGGGERRPAVTAEKQRLIRKDTPHYKKHFKINKLPKPEAVAALLQGFTPESLLSPPRPGEDNHHHHRPTPEEEEQEAGAEPEPEEEVEEEERNVTPEKYHRPAAAELEDSRLQVNASQVKVHTRAHTQRKSVLLWLPFVSMFTLFLQQINTCASL